MYWTQRTAEADRDVFSVAKVLGKLKVWCWMKCKEITSVILNHPERTCMCLPNLIHFMAILPIVDETLQCGPTDGDCHHEQTCSEKSQIIWWPLTFFFWGSPHHGLGAIVIEQHRISYHMHFVRYFIYLDFCLGQMLLLTRQWQWRDWKRNGGYHSVPNL